MYVYHVETLKKNYLPTHPKLSNKVGRGQTKTFEPPHDKTNKIICAPSKDQPGHPPSLLVFAVRLLVSEGPSFLHADSEDSDQTGRMSRLIWVFAGRKGHFVVFFTRRLIYKGGLNIKPYNSQLAHMSLSSVRRPHSLNIFSSETTGPIKVKFHMESP